MKVGIMSMQRIINYGSFLQAYGLKKTIESLGHTVEFVDYEINPPIAVDETYEKSNKFFDKILRGIKIIFSAKYRKRRNDDIRQNLAFSEYYKKFSNEWLPVLGVTNIKNITPVLDVLVIGSDEVFNCTQSGEAVGYSLQLFGKDNKANRIITYAASFGNTNIEKLYKYGIEKEIGNLLSKFDAISIRDENSHKIVEQISSIKPIDNVDPVIISDYAKEVPDFINMKDYIVVYAYSGRINEYEAKKIQEFAHKHGKKTLSIGVMQSFTDEYINADPFTMLAYIKNADYVVTDTFHGTVFSIKFQIPFATIIRDSNREKLSDLLKKFNLTDRQVDNINDLDNVLLHNLDKEKIINQISRYKKESINYLKNNLY